MSPIIIIVQGLVLVMLTRGLYADQRCLRLDQANSSNEKLLIVLKNDKLQIEDTKSPYLEGVMIYTNLLLQLKNKFSEVSRSNLTQSNKGELLKVINFERELESVIDNLEPVTDEHPVLKVLANRTQSAKFYALAAALSEDLKELLSNLSLVYNCSQRSPNYRQQHSKVDSDNKTSVHMTSTISKKHKNITKHGDKGKNTNVNIKTKNKKKKGAKVSQKYKNSRKQMNSSNKPTQ